MPRIAGVNIPEKKRVERSLCYIYGIGLSRSQEILKEASVHPDTRVEKLTSEEVTRLRDIIEKNYRVEGDLRRVVGSNIKRLKEIASYRGIRHSRRLPVRGQRTKTNSRTVRGNVRKTMGSGRRKEEKT